MNFTCVTSTFTTLGTTKCEASSKILLRQEEIYGLCDNVELRMRENVEECVDRRCLLSERAIICSWIFSGERNFNHDAIEAIIHYVNYSFSLELFIEGRVRIVYDAAHNKRFTINP